MPLNRLVMVAWSLALSLAAREQAHAQRAPGQSAHSPAQAAPASLDVPIATYEGGEITADELRALLAQMPQEIRPQYTTPEGRKQLLEQAIRFELLAAEAKRRGYDKDERVMSQVKRAATQELIRQRIDEPFTREQVSDEEVSKYYKAHTREFNTPELRRASRILVATEAEAKALIEELSSKDLRAFRQTAQRQSRDEATKLRGGDLAYFDVEGMDEEGKPGPDPALAKAAFTLKTRGDLGPAPIKTDAGYSVLMLTGIKAKVERSLETVADLIRGRLVQDHHNRALDALIDKLKAELKPKVNAELISLIEFKKDSAAPVPRSSNLPAGFPQERPAARVVTPSSAAPTKASPTPQK